MSENLPQMSAKEKNLALKTVEWLTSTAIEGFGPLSSAESLAQEYLLDQSYVDDNDRIDSLINWETTKNFTSGFITGLGGFITIPIAIPAALGAAWLLQARMVAAIAKICGHDIKEDRVQTAILMVLVGQDINEICKQVGIKISGKITQKVIEKIPGEIIKRINQFVGFRLLTKAGEKGIINLTKTIPFFGGLAGGTFDAVTCRSAGKLAKKMFCK